MNDFKNFIYSVKDVRRPDFSKLTDFSYLTSSTVSTDSPLLALLLSFFIAFVILGIILSTILSKFHQKLPIYTKLRGHIQNLTLWLGITGIILILARYEAVYLLSNRFLLFLNLLAILVWGLYIIFYTLFILPKIKIEYLKHKKFVSYLPKSKNNRIKK